ncbi:FMRFamide receptor-like [Lineus longissimus]|uniref:FMRFamide receptor-like n=1 Tax=Lineus longissimus TaxID=88925 RepID=UPI002B4D4952
MVTSNQTLGSNASHPDGTDYEEYSADMTGLLSFQFWTWGVALNTLAILGIIGNILAITVLRHRRMRSSTSCYLIAQAVFDIIVLICSMLFFGLPVVSTAYATLYPYLHPYAYPTSLTAQTGTIYTTVAFTVERYIAVCRPLQASKMCTPRRAIRVILLVTLCSILYNVPRMLEYRNSYNTNPATNETVASYETTAFGADPIFQKVYLSYMYVPVIFLIPFFILSVLNVFLVLAVKKSQRTRAEMNARTSRENNLTIMVIVVVLVFLICQILAMIDNIYLTTVPHAQLMTNEYFIRFNGISTDMVCLNSAINFLLYCVFGNKFRKVFLHIYWCRKAASDRLDTSIQLITHRSLRNIENDKQTKSRPDHPMLISSQRKQSDRRRNRHRNNNHMNGHTKLIDMTPESEDHELSIGLIDQSEYEGVPVTPQALNNTIDDSTQRLVTESE